MQFARVYGYIVLMKQDAIITSAANPTVKWLRSLSLRKNREEEGVFIIEGERDVTAAMAAGFVLHTLITIPAAAPDMTAPHRVVVSPDIMSRIVNRDNAQAVMAVFQQRWAAGEACHQGLWLGLEDIRDPGNLGTIIRTADAVSAAGIVLIGQTCDPFSPETVKATVGSLAHIPLVRMTREEFIAWRPSYKGQLACTHLAGAVDFRAVEYHDNCLVIMGSETAGISDTLADVCDLRVKIPMTGGAESLNLGIASALMLYEARRQRL